MSWYTIIFNPALNTPMSSQQYHPNLRVNVDWFKPIADSVSKPGSTTFCSQNYLEVELYSSCEYQ